MARDADCLQYYRLVLVFVVSCFVTVAIWPSISTRSWKSTPIPRCTEEYGYIWVGTAGGSPIKVCPTGSHAQDQHPYVLEGLVEAVMRAWRTIDAVFTMAPDAEKKTVL